MSEIETDLEENKKNSKNFEKYKFKNLYKIENGEIIKISYKDIESKDYILKYNEELEFYIIDNDKKKIRPYLEDLLRKMNIETLQTKLTKLMIVISIISLFMIFVSIIISNSNFWRIDELKKYCEKWNETTQIPWIFWNNNQTILSSSSWVVTSDNTWSITSNKK